jgi:hypothetical protein
MKLLHLYPRSHGFWYGEVAEKLRAAGIAIGDNKPCSGGPYPSRAPMIGSGLEPTRT